MSFFQAEFDSMFAEASESSLGSNLSQRCPETT